MTYQRKEIIEEKPTYEQLVNALDLCAKEYRNLEKLFIEHGFKSSAPEAAETAEFLEKIIKRARP